jgi:hypothetical protein
MGVMVSHRSGETEDSYIADLVFFNFIIRLYYKLNYYLNRLLVLVLVKLKLELLVDQRDWLNIINY